MSRRPNWPLFLVAALSLVLVLQPADDQRAPNAPALPHLSVVLPGHLSYDGIQAQLRQWAAEAPGLAEVGTYGQSSRGKPLVYLHIGNLQASSRPEVMLTACIHGNEPLATAVIMGVAGRLLSQYGRDQTVTRLLDTRDIYIIPVVSPDSYPASRQVDGVDPNRDFPGPHDPGHRSTPSIAAIQTFYRQHHFRAALSGHTSGRMFLFPYGDSTTPSPDDARFRDLFGRMASLAEYTAKPASQLYGRPIHGSEVDWYYRTSGATSCVMEMGTHQHIPSLADTKTELDRTWSAFLLFLSEAPIHASLSLYAMR